MQSRLLIRSLLLFLVTTCFALALRNFDESVPYKKLTQDYSNKMREKRALHKPGFIRTLFSVIYEQYVDTKNTFRNVSKMINDNFIPENAQIVETTTVSNNPNISTTKAPYRITRTEFNKILQRNLRGLVRLYNIELNDALAQSRKNDVEFRRNASREVSKFL